MKRLFLMLLVIALGGAAWAADVDVYVTDYLAKQTVGEEKVLGKEKTDTVTLFAARGEYEPFTFALQPKERLEEVMVTGGALSGPAGIIPAENVVARSIEGGEANNRTLLILGNSWDMAAWAKELFWVTIKVPDNAKAGIYKGSVTITSKKAPVATVKVELEVLPFDLEEPAFKIGWHYEWPGSVEALRATFKDMREHGATNVGPLYGFHMPVNDDDTSQLGTFIDEYIKAGYTKPVMFAAPMNLTLSGLTGYGPIDSKRFQQKYIEVMRKLWAETQKHNIPVIYSIGDEFTNKGIKGVEYAGQLAKLTYEELPEIPITSDCNGYMEVMAMAPYMNFATFNNGWDGIDNHNKGQKLINDKFIEEVKQKSDAKPYFVNAGKGRFPFGFFFWKMSKYGVEGKVEWFYNLGGNGNSQGSIVRIQGTTVTPTENYERSREGIDDLKYVGRLESVIAEAKKTGKAAAEARAAEAWLKKIEASIIPNWTAYSSQGGERWPVDGMEEVDAAKSSAIGSLNAIRREMADHIIAIQKKM